MYYCLECIRYWLFITFTGFDLLGYFFDDFYVYFYINFSEQMFEVLFFLFLMSLFLSLFWFPSLAIFVTLYLCSIIYNNLSLTIVLSPIIVVLVKYLLRFVSDFRHIIILLLHVVVDLSGVGIFFTLVFILIHRFILYIS